MVATASVSVALIEGVVGFVKDNAQIEGVG
jgi:hypothetical protein